MKKILVLILVFGLFLPVAGIAKEYGAIEYSSLIPKDAASTFGLPPTSTLPPTCFDGQGGYDNDETTGERFFICEGANNWVLQGGSGTPEGTAVKSTGETGGVKYLREDGDGTCSWQTVAGGSAPEGTDVLSTGETGGVKYLREDGDGTSSWQTVAGGGGATFKGLYARDMTSCTTNPASPVINEYTTNDRDILAFAFDGGTTSECVQVSFFYDEISGFAGATPTFVAIWTNATGATAADIVTWQVQCTSTDGGDALDAAFTALTSWDDAVTADADQMESAASAAHTIAGSPAAKDFVTCKFLRDPDSGTDDMIEDAWLIAIMVE